MISSVIGILLSAGIILKGYGEPVSWELIILVLMSFILGCMNRRLVCLAYTTAFVYGIDFLLISLNVKEAYFTLPYEKLILLVGMLHMIEGILTYFYGAKQNRCIVAYKGNQITGGYEAYRKWYIPLFLFTVKGFYIPLLCVIAYGNETYTMDPENKARQNGLCILGYGSFVLILGVLISLNQLPCIIGIILMPIAHEALFAINAFFEKGDDLYSLPEKGVRVIEINHEQSYKNKIERGDVILKINGKAIRNEAMYYQEIQEKRLVIILQDIKGNIKILNFNQKEYEALEVIILPAE